MPIHSKDVAPFLGHVEDTSANPGEKRDLGNDVCRERGHSIIAGEPARVTCESCGCAWRLVPE